MSLSNKKLRCGTCGEEGHNVRTCPTTHPPVEIDSDGEALWDSQKPLPDGPEMITGTQTLADLVGANVRAVEYQLQRQVDPLPARVMPGGLVVFRSRLRLWLQRYPHAPHIPPKKHVDPHPDIPHIRTGEAVAEWLGMSREWMAVYAREIRPMVPVYGVAVRWAYVEALKDWLDMMSMSVHVRLLLVKARRAGFDIPILSRP